MRIHSCALSCALTLLAGRAPAAEPAQVIVTGARYDQRRDDTASTIVVGRDELLQHGDRSLAEALARVPGITVRAGQAGSSTIRMRGLGDGYTQVLLNGVAAPAGFAPESLAPELIERIDIVRTAAAELGAQGIAGTINIILRKSIPEARRSAKLSAEAERGYVSPVLSAELAGKGEHLSYTVSGTLSRTRQLTESVEREFDRTLERETNRYELNTVDVASVAPRVNLKLDDGARLSVHGVVSVNRRTADGENHETHAVSPSAIAHSAVTLVPRAAFVQWGLGWERPLASGARLQLDAGASDSHRRSEFEFAGLPRGDGPVHLVSVRLRERDVHSAAKYRVTLAGVHQVLVGWDAARTARDQTRAGNDTGLPADTRRETYLGVIERAAVFIQDDWQLGEEWALSLGLRAEGLNTTAGETGAAPVRLHTRVVSPLLQALYKPDKSTQLRVGLTRTYKAPSMFALIPRRFVVDNNNNETNPDTQGNPALRPETAWGLDAGVDYQLGKDAMLGASIFTRRIDDVTVRRLERDAQGWVALQTNGARAVASGVLLEGRLPLALLWRGAPAVSARFSVARNYAKVEGRVTPLDGQERTSATAGLDYRTADGALALGASFSYKSDSMMRWSDTVASASGPVRALDVTGVWEAAPGRRLRVGAVNLMQREARSAMYAGARSTTVLQRKQIGVRVALAIATGK